MSRVVHKPDAASGPAGLAPAPRPGPSPADAAAQTSHLGHELANLLDASLRNVGLALSSLHEASAPKAIPANELAARLESAQQGLEQMAVLLRRWMSQNRSADNAGADRPSSATWLYQQTRSMRQMIEHAVRLLGPAASLRRIEIHIDLPEEAGRLPAGPIYPIIANALRNSIEAIAGWNQRPANHTGQIHVVARLHQGQIELVVLDDGPGLDPLLLDSRGQFRFGSTTKLAGHGLGLSLSREIAQGLGGTLRLSSRESRGTALVLRIPVVSLVEQREA